MAGTIEFDHFAVGADLDAASWDSYPLGYLEVRSDVPDAWKAAYVRQGDPDAQAFHHDLYRAVGRGRFWIMEQQPGPVNWAPWNPAPLAGMVRLWTWEAFAHGAEAVCYFRWRQAPFAQEQMHAGLLTPDSRDAPGFGEAAQVARELGNDRAVPPIPPARVGLVFDYASAWAWRTRAAGPRLRLPPPGLRDLPRPAPGGAHRRHPAARHRRPRRLRARRHPRPRRLDRRAPRRARRASTASR